MTAAPAPAEQDWRDRVLSDPDMILEDRDLMRALIAANERQMGKNIIDLRGIAMERLEARLDRLEETHRSVIAAAYENLAGTNQIHRTVLKVLTCDDFAALLDCLATDVADILRVDMIRLVLESAAPGPAPHDIVTVLPQGAIGEILTPGRDRAPRAVTLRQCAEGEARLFGEAGADLRSEGMLLLDLGEGRLPAVLALGAEDPHQFRTGQGTDLLGFFAGVLQRVIRSHLDT